MKEFFILRRYAINNYTFTNFEKYGSYFFMVLSWGALVPLIYSQPEAVEFVLTTIAIFFWGCS